jgi:hypothetical protein
MAVRLSRSVSSAKVLVLAGSGLLTGAIAGACSATGDPQGFTGTSAGSGGNTSSSGTGGVDLDASQGDAPIQEDPKTCEQAAASRSYLGCDFWPTVVDNIVRPIFDYAVVVANAGDQDADVVVTQNGNMLGSTTVPPKALATLYLPWVDALKSTTEGPFCGPTSVRTSTVRATGGAYRLSSSVPVAVYQFNAIEYAGTGGPAGKDWAALCDTGSCISDCFSYTNDASLLLPATALTGNYRIAGPPAWADTNFTYPPYFAVTGTQDGTSVTVKLGSGSGIVGGGGVSTTAPGGTATFTLEAGEVVEVVGDSVMDADLSGTLVQASAPVQIIAGIACSQNPHGTFACDHLEESVFPAETLGKHYFVTQPTGPAGNTVGHVVRIYGNVNGTVLTYPGGNPGAPSGINAGEVVDLGVVDSDFEIVGDHEFVVGSYMVGADMISPGVPIEQQKGDPSQSFMTTVEQYRSNYVFLAPSDYDVSYVDVVAPTGTELTLDGATVSTAAQPLSSGFGVVRVLLGAGNGGAHVLKASAPVGIQVIGYGTYTSYQYPGGLNLGKIAPPPPE